MEHLPRIDHIAVQPQSSRVIVKIERNTSEIYWTDHLHVDVQRHLFHGTKDNKIERESNAQLVSVYANRCGTGQWSFLGLGSQKKWCSISEDSPQGEWDNIAERMI